MVVCEEPLGSLNTKEEKLEVLYGKVSQMVEDRPTRSFEGFGV